jgi:hypothetical protein
MASLLDKNLHTSLESEDLKKKRYILKYLLRCPSLMEGCADLLQSISLFKDFPELEFIWDSAYAFYKQYRKCVTLDALVLDIDLKFDASTCPFTLTSIKETIEGWWKETDLSPVHVSDIIHEYVKEVKVNDLRDELDTDPESITVDKLQKLAETLRPTIQLPQATNPFLGDPNIFLAETIKIPIGISFIDDMLEGGTIPGETVGFIIPSGVGKTTLVMQGAAECINRQKHVMVAQFEQRLKGDLTKRMYVLSSRSTRADWISNDISKVRGDVLQRWRLAAPLWRKYLHFYDNWVSGDFPLRSVREMFEVIDRLAGEGNKPEVLFIDWWGRLCRKLEASYPGRVSDYDKRQLHQRWLHEIKSYSEDFNVRTFVFHQLAGAQAAKSSKFVASAHDAQENKNFPQMFDYCFVSSKKDSEDNVIFKLDKARATVNSQRKVHLDGERCKFIPVSEDYGSSSLIEAIDDDEEAVSDFE